MNTIITNLSSKDWSLSLSKPNELAVGVADVAQCIEIICTTQKGTSPLRPNFGVDLLAYIDRPINQVIPNLIREIIEQVALFEPRATITSITHEIRGVGEVAFFINFDFANISSVATPIIQL